MEHKEYWNTVANEKNFTIPFLAEEFAKYVQKDAAIVDVGCGYGRILNELYKEGYNNLIGIDFAKEMIERGKTLYKVLDLRVSDGENMSFEDCSIDAVVLFAVLTCIPEDGGQEALMHEIMRILKPGGFIYINDFLLNMDERNIRRYKEHEAEYGIGRFRLEGCAVMRHHERAYIESLVAPYEKCFYQDMVYTTMNGHTSNGFCFIGKKHS